MWQYNPYVLALASTAALEAAIAFFAWRRRPATGAATLSWLMLAGCLWSLAYSIEIGAYDLTTKMFLSRILYLGVVSIPVLWLILSLQYTGREKWLTPRTLLLLAVIPAITLILVWTNDLHGLIWREFQVDASKPFAAANVTYGSFFWVSAAYSYLLILSGSILFLQSAWRSPNLYRSQGVALLVAALAPLAGNVLYISGLNPFPGLDLTPFAFAITGVALAWAMFRFRLFDIVPVARDAVVEDLSAGVLVLDAQDRIVDLNPAAARIIGLAPETAIGQAITQALSDWPTLLEKYQEQQGGEVAGGEGAAQRHYELQISSLQDRDGRLTGRLLVLHDLTERKRTEEALQRQTIQLQATAEVARDAAAARDLDDLLYRTVNLVRDRLGYYHVGIFLLDETSDPPYAVLRAATGDVGRRMIQQGHRLRVGQEGIVGHVLYTGQPRVALDVGTDAMYFDNPDLPETRSEIALPLRVRGKVIGVLDVQSRKAADFDEADAASLQTMADQLAVAIENARLLQEMEQALHELEAAYRRYTQESWREVSRGDGRPRGYRYRQSGLEPTDEQSVEARQAWQQEAPVVVAMEPQRGDGARAAAIPIKLREQVIGVLELRSESEPIPEDILSLVEDVAQRLALTMEGARLYQDARRRAARERMIAEITARLRATPDIDTILRTAVQEIGRNLGASEGVIWLGDVGGETA